VRLFLDTSVLLAAAGSGKGASHYLIEEARAHTWALLSAPYCVEEAVRNARKIGPKAPAALAQLVLPKLALVPTELAFDKALVFPKAKDRPVLLSALGTHADCLLTLDETDFQNVIGSQVYGMDIRTPGMFLVEQREAGRL
jgi:predicted nucleic acid-binding protein